MVSVLTLGAMFAALANGLITDQRWSILPANVISLIGFIIQAASYQCAHDFHRSVYCWPCSRSAFHGCPSLCVSELSPPNLRRGLVALQQFGITAGIMVAFWLNLGTQHIGGTGDGQSSIAWRLPLAL